MFSTLSFIDSFIIISFLIICLIIGIVNAFKVKTLKDFTLGTRLTSTNVLICIIFASSIGAGSVLGSSEKIYLLGIIFLIRELLMPLQWLIAAKIIAPNIEKFRGCLSISQVMYKLYGNPGRWITNICSICMGLGAIAAQASAIGYVFHYFLGIDIAYGIFISYAVLTIYSLLGGIKSIIPTEIFKAFIFFLALPICLVKSSSGLGGLDAILANVPETHTNFEFNYTNILMIISFVLFSLLPGVDGPLVQRYLMAPNAKELKKTFINLACLSLPFYIILCVIAYMVKAFAPNVPGNEVFLYFIANFLPIGLKGLMVAGLMAIIMSMAESWLNSTSVIIVNDILKVLFPNMSDRKQLFALRVSVALLSMGSIFIVLHTKGILELIWLIQNFWYPIIAIPIYAGFMNFRSNSKSFVISVIFAMVGTIAGRYLAGEFAIISFAFGILGSAVGLFTTHYYQRLNNLLEKDEKFVSDISFKQSVIFTRRNVSIFFKKIYHNVRDHLNNVLKERISGHKIKFGQFCVFTFSYYIIYSLSATTYYGHQIFNNLIMAAYPLTLTLLLKDFIFPKAFIRRYFHLYWYLVLTFCLPFISNYMLFVRRGDDFWLIGSIMCYSALFYFVDSIRFMILSTIGTLGAFILFKFTEAGLELSSLAPALKSISYIYMFMIIAALVYFRQREKEHDLKVETMEIFSGAMAHEVRSPLAAMQMNAEQLQMMITDILKNKTEIDKDNFNINTDIDKEDMELLEMLLNSQNYISRKGIKTIDGLLTTLKTNSLSDDDKINNIKECIDEALQDYITTNHFGKQVTLKNIENFQFHGSSHFFKHVISNLLNNSQKYGGAGVQVEIWAENNKLYLRDNGKGIPHDKLDYIFDKFFTDNKTGTGIGLPFCKMIMESIGGDIECESDFGEYTLFTLTFPKIKQNEVQKFKLQTS